MRCLILLSFLFVHLGLYAQVQKPVVKPIVVNTCETVSNEAIQLIPYYLEVNNLDSAAYYAREWKDKCGRNKFNERINLLLSIKDDSFTQFMVDYSAYVFLLDDLADHRLNQLIDTVYQNPTNFFNQYYNPADLILAFDKASKDFAKKTLQEFINNGISTCDLRYQMLTLYAGDLGAFEKSIKSSECSDGRLPQLINELITKIEKKKLVHVALSSGIWIPTENVSILGVHPTIGFLFGVGSKKYTFDLNAEFRFVNSKNNYTTLYQGNLITTDYFFGGFAGLDATRTMLTKGKSNLHVVGGVGIDGIDVVESDTDNDIDGKSILSFNANAGLGYRYINTKGSYSGIDVRYNFVQYDNNPGTSFSGNTISVRLTFGLIANDKKRRQLNEVNRLFGNL
jgi:hypothetical protein